MKKLLTLLIGILLASAIGCGGSADKSNKNLIGIAALTGTGQVSFSFDETSTGASKSIAGPTNAPLVTALVVTITDAANNTVYNAVSLPVTSLNGQYITQPLTLAAGSYHLTSFAAVNSSGTALYASPLEGSALAYLVNDPLPINFTVAKNTVSKLVPEVLSTATYTVGDFGYATFNFDIVETIDFLAGVLAYNETSTNYELTDAVITVTSGTTTLYSGTLPAAITAVKVRDGYTSYTVTITKSGYADYTHTFTNAELKAYTSTPLTVTLNTTSAEFDIHYAAATGSRWDGTAWVQVFKNRVYAEDSELFMNLSSNDIAESTLAFINYTYGKMPDTTKNAESWYSWGSGVDGIWFSGDDLFFQGMSAIGPEHIWNDTINEISLMNSLPVEKSNPFLYSRYTPNVNDYIQENQIYSVGSDNTPLTADDILVQNYIYAYDTNNRLTQQILNYYDYGTISTASSYRTDITYGAGGPIKVEHFNWDIANSIWVSSHYKDITYVDNRIASTDIKLADGTQIARVTAEYNSENRVSKLVVYNSAGPNGVWGDSDDVVGVCNNSGITIAAIDMQPFFTGTGAVVVFEYDPIYHVCIKGTSYLDAAMTQPTDLFENEISNSPIW